MNRRHVNVFPNRAVGGAGAPCPRRTSPQAVRRFRLSAALAMVALGLFAQPLLAGAVRIATFNAELDRDGPGVLLRDILRGKDPQIASAVEVIAAAAPDILVLQRFDYDHELHALGAFADLLAAKGTVHDTSKSKLFDWSLRACLSPCQ